ncbi:MAG: ABC transporter substrate-binding protein [Anaerolineaceae bacterium]|nr:ABC transporter substrate-binding protein [Anaerolineaceae bacterium]
MMKKVYILFVLFMVFTLAITACKPAEVEAPAAEEEEAPAVEEEEAVVEEPCTVKVGVPTLLTGVGAPMGMDVKAGAELAAMKLNEEGGVLGCQIELVFADIKATSAEDCALGAQVMDEAGVVFYVPGAFYGPACIDEFGKREPLMMHNSASADMLNVAVENMPEYNNVFMTCEDEYSYGPNAYKVIVDVIGGDWGYEFPNKKVALLGGDITYDMYIQEGARKAFEDAGWEVVLDDTYPYGNTEFGSQLATIRAEEPAVIMGQLTSNDSAVAFMNQFLTNPTNSLIYIQWSPASPEFINLLQEKANGVMWQSLIDILPKNKDTYYPMFEAEFDRIPGTWPPAIWDHFQIWKAAVESCGDFEDYDCIVTYVDELDDHPVEGICGVYGMDPDMNKGRTGDDYLPMQFIQIQGEANVTLFLGTKAEEGVEFITPPWIE